MSDSTPAGDAAPQRPAPQAPAPQRQQRAQAQPEQVTVRRAPKIPAFMAVGAVLGFFATLIVTGLFPADENVGFATLVAYFSIYGITIGVLIGAILGVILDRRSRKRARTLQAERETIDPAPVEGELEQ